MLRFCALGCWKPGQISVSWTGNTRLIVDSIERDIQRCWQDAMTRPGIHLFDGPLCRLEKMEPSHDAAMRLVLSHTSYKTFWGTNLAHGAELMRQHGPSVLANPVGLSCALLSADGYLLLGRRNGRVAYYPDRIHPFAGGLEPAADLDVFTDVRRELREELALDRDHITELACTGLVEDLNLCQPEMIFSARLRLNLQEINSRLDATEHRGIWSVPATPPAIEQALASDLPLFTPVALAAILLWGRIEFGQHWFQTNAARHLSQA